MALFFIATREQAPSFERIYPLAPSEGVFAYSRISPDGKTLAYASETEDPNDSNKVTQTVTLVDLTTQKILWSEPGIDAYWSPDGKQMIYLAFQKEVNSVSIRENSYGNITRGIAPAKLGDYFSWAVRDGKDLILTIESNYYYLENNIARLPESKVLECPGIGKGERPLISKDGQMITTFVRGNIVVRNLTDCNYIFNTGIHGAKADFSFDGRYIAFHAPKKKEKGYEIQVVDLEEKTVRTITNFSGSSLFPSWTEDGRLSFRYDGEDYRGFMMVSDVLSARTHPLLKESTQLSLERTWQDIFPETPLLNKKLNVVLVWAPSGAHSAIALSALEQAQDYFDKNGEKVGVLTAVDPASIPSDVEKVRTENDIELPQIYLDASRLILTEINNQNPSTLLFENEKLVDRRLGAQSFEDLRDWVMSFYSHE